MKARLISFFVSSIGIIGLLGCCSEMNTQSPSLSIESLSKYQNIAPILVIGSGPAGLMASVYGARGGKDTFLVEGDEPGGLLMKTTEVANWPGETMIQGPEIIKKMRAQAEHQNVNFIQDQVASIDTSSWPYKVTLDNDEVVHALTIIVATGASPRRLNVEGEERYWGAGVTACAICDAQFYKGEEVVVIGGGDSAVEEAIQLSPYASKITILVRKDAMRAAPTMQARLKEYPKIDVKYNVEVKRIIGNDQDVTGVELYNNKEKTTEAIKTSGVFLAIGHIPNSSFLKDAVKTDEEGYVIVQSPKQATSQAGIYAAGDIADRIYRQAGTSAGTGIQAALDAVQFLEEVGYTNKAAESVADKVYGVKPSELSELVTIRSFDELKELEVAKEDTAIVMDFSTAECASCKQMLPALKEAALNHKEYATFVSIDADEVPELAEQYQVDRVPTLVVVRNGKMVDKHAGFLGKKELLSYMEKALKVG